LAVLACELLPDTPRRISKLADQYTINATPLREALSRFEARHLVVAIPIKG
jgi:DNA-binding GntR family transcriptional regulator